MQEVAQTRKQKMYLEVQTLLDMMYMMLVHLLIAAKLKVEDQLIKALLSQTISQQEVRRNLIEASIIAEERIQTVSLSLQEQEHTITTEVNLQEEAALVVRVADLQEEVLHEVLHLEARAAGVEALEAVAEEAAHEVAQEALEAAAAERLVQKEVAVLNLLLVQDQAEASEDQENKSLIV